MTTGVVPRLSDMRWLALCEFAREASFLCANGPMMGMEPKIGQPDGPGAVAYGVLWALLHAKPPGTSQDFSKCGRRRERKKKSDKGHGAWFIDVSVKRKHRLIMK